jgi:hypothetical protein
VTCNEPRIYQLRVVGHLDDRWSTWFGEFTIAPCDDGTCTLTGVVADQAQLHGVLARLRDLGATLVSLRTIDAAERRLTELGADPARCPDALLPGGW